MVDTLSYDFFDLCEEKLYRPELSGWSVLYELALPPKLPYRLELLLSR